MHLILVISPAFIFTPPAETTFRRSSNCQAVYVLILLISFRVYLILIITYRADIIVINPSEFPWLRIGNRWPVNLCLIFFTSCYCAIIYLPKRCRLYPTASKSFDFIYVRTF